MVEEEKKDVFLRFALELARALSHSLSSFCVRGYLSSLSLSLSLSHCVCVQRAAATAAAQNEESVRTDLFFFALYVGGVIRLSFLFLLRSFADCCSC